MEFTTKLNYGDKLWKFHEQSPQCFTIVGMTIYSYKKDNKIEVHVKYYAVNSKGFQIEFYENKLNDEVFANKKELIDSLIKKWE